jgi:universal stress protein A
MLPIRRMLVPTDFSTESNIAVDYAIDVASRYGGAIHVLHVLDDMSFASAYPDGFYVELPGVRERLIEEAERRLAEVTAKCATARVATTSQVRVGRPAAAIVEQATNRGTDLIVMGTHGRSGFAHLVLGSVAERVLRTAPCPVLVVRNTARVADIMAAEAATGREVSQAPA